MMERLLPVSAMRVEPQRSLGARQREIGLSIKFSDHRVFPVEFHGDIR